MDEEDVDIAAAMGFSSFGATKKRKFDQTARSPKGRADASGANSTELGVRPKRTENIIQTGPQPSAQPQAHSQPASGLADFLARGQSLPDRPESAPQSEVGNDSAHSEMVS